MKTIFLIVPLLLPCLLLAGCSRKNEEPVPTTGTSTPRNATTRNATNSTATPDDATPDDATPNDVPAGTETTVIETHPIAAAVPAMSAKKITYQLPLDGPLPRTYRVTLAVTPVDEPDWIVSTFVSGGVRTVTEQNKGRFEASWSGLDENDMPLPPGTYRVKGIYMPAEKWKIDGQYHSVIPQYLMSVGDSWGPTPENDGKPPWIFGHQFGPISDVAVAPNGIGGFLGGYVESGRNPYLVDLKKPVGYDQVLKTFKSSGSAGGPAIACDGEFLYAASADGGEPFIYRADRGWGAERTSVGIPCVKTEVLASSLCVWKDLASDKTFLFAAQPAPANKVFIFSLHDGKKIAETPVKNPLAVFTDHTGKTGRLFTLHEGDVGKWAISVIQLKDGLPTAAWSKVFDLPDIKVPTDADMDSAGNFYVASSAANQVVKLDKKGNILAKFGKNEGAKNGSFDENSFTAPHRLATWTDPDGKDRILVVESASFRVSEWLSDGTFLRQWFLCREAARGFCMDPENPQDVYQAGNGTLFRYKVDYDKPGWKLDAFSTEHFLGGLVFPQILNVKGKKYLAFPGGNDSGHNYGIYRIEGDRFVPSAGLIRKGNDVGKNEFWWNDANGNGKVEEGEYKNNAAQMVHEWDAHYWLDDLSLVMVNPKDSFLRSLRFLRMKPSSFDSAGNPVFKTDDIKPLLEDPVYKAVVQKKADILHGGNEVSSGYGSWERVVAGPEDDYYLAYNFGPNGWGGVDTAGVRHSLFKLCRLIPDGQGGLKMKWRVGRKAWGVAEPGRVYGSFHLQPPSHRLVGVFDMNGFYHLYTTDGLWVDTLMFDGFKQRGHGNNMYSHGGEFWYGRHFLNKDNGKVYLFMGRSGANIYECKNWAPGLVKRIKLGNDLVKITAADIAPPNEFALRMRGGAGVAKVASFMPSAGGPPALDGSLAGWETARPISFGLDQQRKAEVRCMFDASHLYLRWQILTPDKFKPAEDTDLVRIFTHDRQATTASFYIQCDPHAAGGRENGRPADARIVFAIVGDPTNPRPVALGMYSTWKGPGKASSMTYISPTGKAPFEHVAVLKNAKLGFAVNRDRKGYSLAAAIPLKDLPGLPRPGSALRTMVDYSVTLNGTTAFWWANTLGLNNTLTTDEPSEARLYPGSWAPAQFTGIEVLPIRQWSVCGPWGGKWFKEEKAKAGKGAAVSAFFTRFYMNAKYPPNKGDVDVTKTYRGPDTRDWEGKEKEVKWRAVTTSKNKITADGNPFRLYFAATWVWVPSDMTLSCDFHTNEGGTGNCRGWINGKPMPEVGTTVHGINARELARSGKLKFKKGWNQILMRGWGHWVPTTFGMTIHGPENILWQIKVSPTPP